MRGPCLIVCGPIKGRRSCQGDYSLNLRGLCKRSLGCAKAKGVQGIIHVYCSMDVFAVGREYSAVKGPLSKGQEWVRCKARAIPGLRVESKNWLIVAYVPPHRQQENSQEPL